MPTPSGVPEVYWSIGPWGSTAAYELRNVTDRKVTFSLLEPNEATFNIAGKPHEAIDVGEGINDLHIWRNGIRLDRQRIVVGNHDFNENRWSCNVSARDYRHLLDLRPLRVNLVWSIPTDKATIVWDIVTNAQSWGTLGITQAPGWSATGSTLTSAEARDGTDAWKGVMSIAETSNGLEPYINADLQLSLNYLGMGSDKGVVLDYQPNSQGGPAGAVRRLGLSRDFNTFANAIRQYGADGTTPVEALVANAANSPEGVWAKAETDSALGTNAQVAAAAPATLAKYSTVFPEYTVELTPGWWGGPSHLWLGDTVTQVVKAGQFNIERQARVQEIRLSWDNNNVETVSLAVSKNSLKGRRLMRQVVHKIQSLG